MRYLLITAVFIILMTGLSEGAGRRISENGNKHNFSYFNMSTNFKAVQGVDIPGYDRSSQICVFCHTPHRSSSEGPLWNRVASSKSFFKHFSSSTLTIDDPSVRAVSEYGQPTGTTRLCLSCHDGVTALGAVFTTPSQTTSVPIQFINTRTNQTGANVAIGYETYSTHHPVSFKYDANVMGILNAASTKFQYLPPSPNEVKRDKLQRMQCTTCHDPHQDRSAVPSNTTPFWTTDTYIKVCDTCHIVSQSYPWN